MNVLVGARLKSGEKKIFEVDDVLSVEEARRFVIDNVSGVASVLAIVPAAAAVLEEQVA